MTLLDRTIFYNFLRAWLITFVSLVSLYIVIDIFNKFDEFLEAAQNDFQSVLFLVASYYSYQMVLIFDRISGVLVVLAAMFTIAWMQRNNEFICLLSSGISVRRILWPILVGGFVVLTLSLANREILMPHLAEKLMRPATDPRGELPSRAYGAFEPNGILISGNEALRRYQLVYNLTVTIPERLTGSLQHIRAQEARYIPPGTDHYSGGWLLLDTTPKTLPENWNCPVLEMIDPGKFFLRTERVDFDLITRPPGWFQYASTWMIFQELQRPETIGLSLLAVQFHLRLTMPLLTLIMTVIGLSLLLRDHQRNLFLNTGLCLVVGFALFGAHYLCRHLGEHDYLGAVEAAWLPIFLFGPLAVWLWDAIQT
ncbi:MAG: LptF/LptG family permease [Gemmatales bacterium]|nr:LptF/LptG family permease [Gemmatales bacterium]MCS7160473.1 LptF/LptG family permease [Gemmatales bacterium]MDW8175673.1 LptF/LptG family permease [Gemmatales bacterium]MDW8222470.1 LptF/LptG family permease [Gemmatales bacterium]